MNIQTQLVKLNFDPQDTSGGWSQTSTATTEPFPATVGWAAAAIQRFTLLYQDGAFPVENVAASITQTTINQDNSVTVTGKFRFNETASRKADAGIWVLVVAQLAITDVELGDVDDTDPGLVRLYWDQESNALAVVASDERKPVDSACPIYWVAGSYDPDTDTWTRFCSSTDTGYFTITGVFGLPEDIFWTPQAAQRGDGTDPLFWVSHDTAATNDGSTAQDFAYTATAIKDGQASALDPRIRNEPQG